MWFQRFRHGPYPGNECVQRHRGCLSQIDVSDTWLAGAFGKSGPSAIAAGTLFEEPRNTFKPLFVLGFGEGVLHGGYGVVVREVEFGEIVAFFRLV